MPNLVNYTICFLRFLSLCLLLSTTLSYAEPARTNNSADTTNSKPDAAQTEPIEKKQYYIVEVLLFRQLNEQGMQEEYWSRPEDQGITGDTSPLTDETPALAEYNLTSHQFLPLRKGIGALSREYYKLADSAANLRYSPDYRLLAHFGWTQRSLSRRYALPIKITADNVSDSLLPEGELKLSVSRFLHLEVNLAASHCEPLSQPSADEQAQTKQQTVTTDKALDQKLAQGITPESAVESEAQILNAGNCINKVYRFKQNRKMRSKELHYLDNPVYGLLVYITPFTIGGENEGNAAPQEGG